MSKASKKRGGKIFLTVICIIFAALLVAGYLFREEISIFISAVTSSEEAIESQKAENDKKTQELLDKLSDVTMRDLTDEERKMLESGLLSHEDALKLIMGETLPPVTDAPAPETADIPAETTDIPQESTVTTEAESTKAVTDITEVTTAATTAETVATTKATTTAATVKDTPNVLNEKEIAALKNRQNEIIAEIYLLRATYLNKIDELVEALKKEYIALPKNKHNTRGKLEMLERVVIPRGNALEDECDDKMDSLLAELKGILESLGEDKSLIKEISNAYVEQKRLKKTELMNTYMPK